MDHVVFVDDLRVVQGRTVKDKVAWASFFNWHVHGAGVPLVALITATELEPELLLEVLLSLSYQSAAIEEYFRVVQRVVL